MNNTLTVQIPFAGFYCAHEYHMDREIEDLANNFYLETGNDMPESLNELMHGSVDYSAFTEAFSKAYVESFLSEFCLEGEFDGLESPKFYNFSTDRVFAKITRDSVAKMYRGVCKKQLAEAAKEAFTSRDGFISHYSPDIADWGLITEWDHNQLAILIKLFADTESLQGEYNEHDVIDSGNVYEEVHSMWTEASNRFFKLYDYLIARAQRP